MCGAAPYPPQRRDETISSHHAQARRWTRPERPATYQSPWPIALLHPRSRAGGPGRCVGASCCYSCSRARWTMGFACLRHTPYWQLRTTSLRGGRSSAGRPDGWWARSGEAWAACSGEQTRLPRSRLLIHPMQFLRSENGGAQGRSAGPRRRSRGRQYCRESPAPAVGCHGHQENVIGMECCTNEWGDKGQEGSSGQGRAG